MHDFGTNDYVAIKLHEARMNELRAQACVAWTMQDKPQVIWGMRWLRRLFQRRNTAPRTTILAPRTISG